LRVQGIKLLFHVVLYWNHQQRFAKPSCFIQGFEPGGASDAAAFRQHSQKFRSVQFVERQRES
jgi:hypothetical protein